MLPTIQSIQAVPLASESESGHGSLDEHMLGELAKMSGAAAARQSSLLSSLHATTSTPETLLEVQRDVAKFQLGMSVTASLARKAVGAIETLVKS